MPSLLLPCRFLLYLLCALSGLVPWSHDPRSAPRYPWTHTHTHQPTTHTRTRACTRYAPSLQSRTHSCFYQWCWMTTVRLLTVPFTNTRMSKPRWQDGWMGTCAGGRLVKLVNVWVHARVYMLLCLHKWDLGIMSFFPSMRKHCVCSRVVGSIATLELPA